MMIRAAFVVAVLFAAGPLSAEECIKSPDGAWFACANSAGGVVYRYVGADTCGASVNLWPNASGVDVCVRLPSKCSVYSCARSDGTFYEWTR